ncbi:MULTISPECIES: hypothetical protein [unclassified Sphingomonas]|uniref:hypothetical protein n=1 Tax=unclassified Sphingomonas TaxID=196159 RepID=UPI0006FA0ABA|nr:MULTISPECIES: hypothetical protein [unclassified Sphingomonas]KQX26023.1 hypothetical protein ASD17_00700 [Sphingomonas sp. Root1294]KQY69089.1 hypothetical protein ASD39_01895 [Sphingomonas sp. Root50]KRB89343.1 hypothetical protein ASE22_16810 [Sphingomonas sp. Root720]
MRRFILSQQEQLIDHGSELVFIMAFQIKRKGPGKADLLTEDKYEDAIHTAHRLIQERVPKTRTTVTNLKTGETLSQDDIEEAALSVGAPKRRSANG